MLYQPPQTAARISWAYPQRGQMGCIPLILVKGTHIQMRPNYWAQYLHYMVYPLSFTEKNARSIALYKFLFKLHKIAYTGIL